MKKAWSLKFSFLTISDNKAHTSPFKNRHTARIFLDQYRMQFSIPVGSCQSWAKPIYHRWLQNGF